MRVALITVAGVALVALACAKTGGDGPAGLAAQDLQTQSSTAFDPDEILDPASMQDTAALDAGGVQQFLQQTPYAGTSSFLAEYSSNGIPAATAIVTAAQRYSIDPIVFLVRAEMDDGLIASTSYPSPSSRVEYAFGCGCTAPGSCDPTYAGFDVQVDCLGAALRDDLDSVAATGQTSGGWGPNIAGTTLDGVTVTPTDDSTATLYQYTPIVAVGQAGGNWLFWNLWNIYASALGYVPPDGGAGPASWVGDACTSTTVCAYEGTPGTCATQFPGGLCTLACTGSCPSSSTQAQTFCADFGAQGGFCLAVCDPNDPQCRPGYTCESVKQFGDTSASMDVCFPK